jgi:hypothetical protein
MSSVLYGEEEDNTYADEEALTSDPESVQIVDEALKVLHMEWGVIQTWSELTH